MKGSTAMWNYDAVDKKEAVRMASLYGEDATRTVEHGTEAETGELLVRSCGNELGFATWEAFDFERNTWLCEAFENREAAELWLSGEEVDTCFELDDQLVQSTKRMAALAANMSGGRWTAGIHEYKDGRKSLSFQLSDDAGVYENPIAAIGTMLAEAALEHARADAEYFDEDFRMRATEGINLWTVAKEIIEAVPAAKPAEEEPAQARGPKH